MKLIYLISFCFFLITSSCNTGKESQQDDKQIIITPTQSSDFISDFTPYIDTIIVVPLETTPQSLISYISKMFTRPNGDIIIPASSGILVFNKEGKFLYTIGKQGQGPEEYSSATDICLSQDSQILNILTATEEIVSYHAENGAFIRKILPLYPETNTNISAIASGCKGSFFLFSFSPESGNHSESSCKLYHFNAEGYLLKSYPISKNQPVDQALITQSYDNQYILRPQDSDNVCYYLGDSLPNPRIKINFGKKTLPEKYSGDLQTYLRSDYYKMPIYIHETADQFFFNFCGPEAREYYSIYSFPSDKIITWKRTGNDDMALFQLTGSDREYFYGIYNDYRNLDELPLTEIDILKKAIVQRTRIELHEDSNPALLKIKFKL